MMDINSIPQDDNKKVVSYNKVNIIITDNKKAPGFLYPDDGHFILTDQNPEFTKFVNQLNYGNQRQLKRPFTANYFKR